MFILIKIDYPQNSYSDSFNTKAKFPLPKAAYHVGIAYHIWYRQGNIDKDPTQYARKIKQMIIIKSQRQENQEGAGGKSFLSDTSFGQNSEMHRMQQQPSEMHNDQNISRSMYDEEQMMQIMNRNNQVPPKQTESELKVNPYSMNQASNNIQKQQAMLGPQMYPFSSEPSGQVSNNMGTIGSPDNMMMQATKMPVNEEPQIINEFKNKLDFVDSDNIAENQAQLIQESKPATAHFSLVNSNINVSKEDVQTESLVSENHKQMFEQNKTESRMNVELELSQKMTETKEAVRDNNIPSSATQNPNKDSINL